MPAHIYHNEEERWCGLFPGSVLFTCGPSSSARSGGAIFGMRCMVLQPFIIGGNQLYP
jgi:hypothetical protein